MIDMGFTGHYEMQDHVNANFDAAKQDFPYLPVIKDTTLKITFSNVGSISNS